MGVNATHRREKPASLEFISGFLLFLICPVPCLSFVVAQVSVTGKQQRSNLISLGNPSGKS
jgi:hypothetical protein